MTGGKRWQSGHIGPTKHRDTIATTLHEPLKQEAGEADYPLIVTPPKKISSFALCGNSTIIISGIMTVPIM